MQGTPEDVKVEPVTMAVIGVSKNFDAVRALNDVSFEIRPGEIHALLGENGAGKSTLMAIAAGTLTPDEGTIRFHGRSYDQLTPGLAQELGIAIVHQHPALLPDMTVAENVQLSVPAEILRAKGSETDAMRAMLDDVGMTAHLRDRVKNLTIAQKHLLEVGKAFALNPGYSSSTSQPHLWAGNRSSDYSRRCVQFLHEARPLCTSPTAFRKSVSSHTGSPCCVMAR